MKKRKRLSRIFKIFLIGCLLAIGPRYGASTAHASQITGNGNWGCKSRSYRKKIMIYGLKKDIPAFRKGLATGVFTGVCTFLKEGEEVFIVETASPGLVKVRRKGEIDEYWTNTEAVK